MMNKSVLAFLIFSVLTALFLTLPANQRVALGTELWDIGKETIGGVTGSILFEWWWKKNRNLPPPPPDVPVLAV